MPFNTEIKFATGTYPVGRFVPVTVIDISVAGRVKPVAGSKIPVRVSSPVMSSAGESLSCCTAKSVIDHCNKIGNTVRKYAGSKIPVRKTSAPTAPRSDVAPTGSAGQSEPTAASNGCGSTYPIVFSRVVIVVINIMQK